MTSVIVYMNAPENSAGYVTKGRPGMAVRMTIADDIMEDGIDLRCEIIGGNEDDRQGVVKHLIDFYDASYKITQEREYMWTANVCLHNVQAARENPLFDAVLTQRQWADKFVMVYEAGMLALRLDFPDHIASAQQDQVTNTLCAAARMIDPSAVARRGVATNILDSWRPLAEVLPPA